MFFKIDMPGVIFRIFILVGLAMGIVSREPRTSPSKLLTLFLESFSVRRCLPRTLFKRLLWGVEIGRESRGLTESASDKLPIMFFIHFLGS